MEIIQRDKEGYPRLINTRETNMKSQSSTLIENQKG